jgi:drug/metabolite transporter (DMT)-like permease
VSTTDAVVSPLVALAVAVLAISTSAILVRWSDAPNVVKALYRVTFTVVALLPLVVRNRGRAAVTRIDRRDGVVAVAAGAALALHFAAWFESLDHTTVAASVTLVQAQPVFVVAGGWLLLGERVTRRSAAGVGVAVGGMAVLSFGRSLLAAVDPTVAAGVDAGTGYGNALALLGAVAVAAYYLAGRSLRRRLSVLPYVIVVYTACAGVLLAVAVERGYPLFGYPLHEWGLFAAMALGPGVLGHTVINWALGHLESHVVSVTLLGEPLGSAVLAAVLLSEVPSVGTALGGAVVLAGIYLTVSGRPAQ